MSIPARLHIVTLGVRDLPRSVAFYEAIGWQRAAASMDEISWFGLGGRHLARAVPARRPGRGRGDFRAKVPGTCRRTKAATSRSTWSRTRLVATPCRQAVEAGATPVQGARSRRSSAGCPATSPTRTGTCGSWPTTRTSRLRRPPMAAQSARFRDSLRA